MMKPVRSGRTALIFSLLFLLFTAALSTVLYQTTKSNPSGTELSSYTLRIEAGKPTSLKSQYTFTVSCIFSESGAPCQEKSSQATVYPGIFSTITLSAPARSGSYRGIRVELLGHRGNPLQIRSVMLQDERIFDGRDISVFRNPQGLTVSQDSTSGLALLELTSDMASFELDAGFTVEGAPAAAIKYTSAVMAAVLFISGVLILSMFGASSGRGVRHRRHRGAGAILRRMSLAWISFSMLMAVAFALGQLFISNEISVSSGSVEPERFQAEVSDTPDFSYAAGSSAFYSLGETALRIPARFQDVRITGPEGSAQGGGFRVSSRGGSCEIRDGVLSSHGSISCAADRAGRLQLDFGGLRGSLRGVMPSLHAALIILGLMLLLFRLVSFTRALRFLLVLIMVSAYITGEICMNVESGNVVFYRSYLQLLPDVTLRNISLILFIVLLVELSFSHGFIRSGTFLELLLLVIVYIAIDWGVFQNFGVRPDLGTMLSHSGADGSTFISMVSAFFRSSHSSWMAIVMLADWIVMLCSIRLREKRSLRSYLVLAILLNCIPFLKVYEGFYTESPFELRKDIFDIQSGTLRRGSHTYTSAFPEYDWKPSWMEIDGLGRRKNVVILLVESLADVYSHHFSGLTGYMPEIDRLAEENASFLNYHSTGMETAPATYSIMTGKLLFSEIDRKTRDLRFEYGEALPNVMKAAGYATAAIYSSEDFGGRVAIYRNSGFEQLYDTHDPAYDGEKRYVFNSVPDKVLLEHASDLIREFDRAGKPHLTFILTTSTHVPYLNPETGRRGYREVLPYTDREVGAFVRRLKESGFFENGTLVIAGDHHPPIRGFEPGEVARYGEDLNRVPLIIIDRDIGKRTFTNMFGHDSLAAIIEYLNLPRVKKYEYQLIPFWKGDEERSVTVLCPLIYQNEYLGGIRVSGPDGEQGVYNAKGDMSEFTSHFLEPEEEREVAGRVKWMKREE